MSHDGWVEPVGVCSDGDWWWWPGPDCAPVVVHVGFSHWSDGGQYFAQIGQYDWKQPRDVKEMGGLWKPLPSPGNPEMTLQYNKMWSRKHRCWRITLKSALATR